MREYTGLAISWPEDGILLVTLNRPERLNALTFEMFDELTTLCRAVESDPSVRVVILTGAGRGFCSGLDLDAVACLGDMSCEEFLRGQEKWAAVVLGLRRLPTPVLAAVNGAATGAGLSIALACDMRVVLSRIVGFGIANELLMTGRVVQADEALRIGLANSVVQQADLLPAAIRLARQISANSPFAVRLTKRVVEANLGAASLQLAIELENRNQALASGSSDMREAFNAFRDKRAPSFTSS